MFQSIKIDTILSPYLNGKMNQNSYLVSTNKGAILFDAGATCSQVESLLNGKKLCAILLTHSHFDHIPYLTELYNKYNAPIYIHSNALQNLRNETKNMSSLFGFKITCNLENSCFKIVNDNDILDLIGENIKCFYMPGHSDDSLCFLTNGVLFVGDLVFREGVGRFDGQTSDPKAMLNSLKRLKKIDFQTIYSGHGKKSMHDEQLENINYTVYYLQEKLKN